MSLPLHIVSIVWRGMPWIATHLPVLNRLSLDWHWSIVFGKADNVKCTAWCAPQPDMDDDGTWPYLRSIERHPRISIHSKPDLWEGKVSMFNHALSGIKEPCVLLEVDADEFYTPDQLSVISNLFYPKRLGLSTSACFYARYFVGPNIVTVGDNCYGNNPGEFKRCFLFTPGTRFAKHEPPILVGEQPHRVIPREETRYLGIVMDHYAYVYPEQVAYKEKFYGYPNALAHWQRLQADPAAALA